MILLYRYSVKRMNGIVVFRKLSTHFETLIKPSKNIIILKIIY